MKKTIMTFALVMAISFAGLNAAQAQWGGGGTGGCNGPGSGRGGGAQFTYEEMEQFHNDTVELRKKLFEARSEYYEVMNQEDPDKELAKQIWGEIFDLQKEMQEKAAASGMWSGSEK